MTTVPGSCPIGRPLPLLPPVCLCPLTPRLVTMTHTMRTPLRLPRAIMLSHGEVCFTHLLEKLRHFLIYLVYDIEQVRSLASSLQGRGPSHKNKILLMHVFCSLCSGSNAVTLNTQQKPMSNHVTQPSMSANRSSASAGCLYSSLFSCW